MNSLVAEVYSDAFFNLSKENDNLDECKSELLFFRQVFSENSMFKKLLENPNIEKVEKKSLLDTVFEGCTRNSINFLKLLIDKSRFEDFDLIVSEYLKKYNHFMNISEGIVYSAREMDSEDMLQIQEILSRKYNKKVELKNIINTDLIGGFQIKLDGKMLDNSIKGRLDNLKSSLKEGKR